ncbi:MAG: hypothetical protein ACLFQK_03650 [Fibrobacterota bacterium]
MAETSGWKNTLEFSTTAAHSYYSDNWDGAETGALSWASVLKGSAAKNFNANYRQENKFLLEFGQTKIAGKDGSSGETVNSSDLIELESMQRFPLGGWADPFATIKAESRFTDERADAAHYVNPLRLTESFGAIKTLMDSEKSRLMLSLGAAVNQNIDRYFPDGQGGVQNKTVNDAGIEAVLDYSGGLKEGVITYSSILDIFGALVRADADEASDDKWKYPDLDWQNTLKINLTEFIIININAQLLYDREISENARIKDVLSAGVTFSLPAQSSSSTNKDEK